MWSHLRVRRGSPADVLILLALLAGAVALRAWHLGTAPPADERDRGSRNTAATFAWYESPIARLTVKLAVA
jgi:hypothetical protein